MHGYSETLWTGGIADVGYEDYQGRIVAGDFKSSKEEYFAHYVQIAGYNIMLEENGGFDAEGNKLFELPGRVERYCVIPFGQEVLSPVIVDEVDDYKAAFKSAVHMHKLNEVYKKTKRVSLTPIVRPTKLVAISELDSTI